MEKKTQKFINTHIKKNPEKEIQLWFQDEARFGQKGMVSKIWTLKGDRPTLYRQNGFKSAYFVGAVNPENGDKFTLIFDGLDTEIMNEFLKRISMHVEKNVHIIMLVDGAGWHRSEDIKIPANITLYPFPPYSPELNAIERLWDYLKENFLSGRIFVDMEEIFDYGVRAWNPVDKKIIKSVCATSFELWSTI